MERVAIFASFPGQLYASLKPAGVNMFVHIRGFTRGVSRIFSGGALFSSKVDDLLVLVLDTPAKTSKLTTPTVQPFAPSKNFLKMTSCSQWRRQDLLRGGAKL